MAKQVQQRPHMIAEHPEQSSVIGVSESVYVCEGDKATYAWTALSVVLYFNLPKYIEIVSSWLPSPPSPSLSLYVWQAQSN